MAFGPVAKKAPIFEDGFEVTALSFGVRTMRICHDEWKAQSIHHEKLRKYYISLLLVFVAQQDDAR